jgi:cardiolipin synthase
MELTDYSVPKQAKTELEDYALVSFKPHAADGNEIMQLTTSSPNYSDQDITRTLVSLITYATKSIKIVTPYLFLTPELHNALKIAIYRRIDIKIIVPGKNDSKDFILALNKNNYYQLQKEQCKVYTYNGFIHSKYVIVDDKFVYTGTNNLDFRSL